MEESDIHQDLLLADFDEHYQNLTLKTIAALMWHERKCSNVPFLFKTDDDVFVNPKMLLQNAQTRLDDKQHFIYCLVLRRRGVVKRNESGIASKWYVYVEGYHTVCGNYCPLFAGMSRTVFIRIDTGKISAAVPVI